MSYKHWLILFFLLALFIDMLFLLPVGVIIGYRLVKKLVKWGW